MQIHIEIAGDVVERQELLNGTQIVALEGVTDDGAWTISASLSWNIGLAAGSNEGDITLTRDDGSEIFATLVRATVEEASESSGEHEYTFVVAYDIDGGTPELIGDATVLDARGSISGDTFYVSLRMGESAVNA